MNFPWKFFTFLGCVEFLRGVGNLVFTLFCCPNFTIYENIGGIDFFPHGFGSRSMSAGHAVFGEKLSLLITRAVEKAVRKAERSAGPLPSAEPRPATIASTENVATTHRQVCLFAEAAAIFGVLTSPVIQRSTRQ